MYNMMHKKAIAAIENGLLDIVGKAYGVPVCALFGGPIRTELEVYWSHCGSFRVGFHEHLHSPFTKQPVPPLKSLADIAPLCEEVKRSGFRAAKTNIFHFDPAGGKGKNVWRLGLHASGCRLVVCPPAEWRGLLAGQGGGTSTVSETKSGTRSEAALATVVGVAMSFGSTFAAGADASAAARLRATVAITVRAP